MPREPIPPRVLRPRPPPVRDFQDNDRNAQQDHPILTPSLPAIQQTSCFLFTIFPPEIRNRIYTFSLESEDIITEEQSQNPNHDQFESTANIQLPPPTGLYRQNAFYYRPGYNKPKRIRTALLQTCQQIYSEASLLPTSINEHTFWFFRGPPHIRTSSSPLEYFSKMSAAQRAQVHHIHLFTQQYFLEDNYWSRIWEGTITDHDPSNLKRFLSGPKRRRVQGPANHMYTKKHSIAPKKLTITFRHTDWWFWEDNEPLGINPFRKGRTRAHEMPHACSHPHPVNHNLLHNPERRRAWGNQFIHIPSLEELVIEFETIMRKRDQLDAIIEQALSWKFPLQPEKSLYLVAEPNSRSAYTWVGAKEGDLKRQSPAELGRALGLDTDSTSEQGLGTGPAVPVLRPFDSQGRDEGRVDVGAGVESDTEEFYVVFLTWKRQVVDE